MLLINTVCVHGFFSLTGRQQLGKQELCLDHLCTAFSISTGAPKVNGMHGNSGKQERWMIYIIRSQIEELDS